MGEAMSWTEGYIAADWGTTNRRAYLIDRSGNCVDEFEDGQGIMSVAPGGFPAAVAQIRERLGEKPLLMAGMIGSNRGWVEAPYVECPADVHDLVAGLVWAGTAEAIVPGVSFIGEGRADVMRGEEVQLLGAVATELVPPNCLVCHPGTHNKWAVVSAGRITSFRTVMTGELFNLLKEHSILSDLLQSDVEPGDAFGSGVRRALDYHDAQAELFTVRARVLLGQGSKEDAASYASGLLIGSDVRIGLAGNSADQVFVMGRPELTELYATALSEAGVASSELDGERCFLAGIQKIAERI
jgi:2-dehydro-3-deoxygalactonokinase